MRIKKVFFIIFTTMFSIAVLVESCFCDTRVESCLGIYSKLRSVAAGKGSDIDYSGYNEALTIAYLKAVYNKNAVDITEEEAAQEFDNIFELSNGAYVNKQMSAIMENENIDRTVRNELDHNFYGEISTLADIKSSGFYISQNNEKYKNIAYSGSNMSVHGCGPISLAMALNILSDQSVYDAETLALWSGNNGYMDPSSGTVWAFINDYSEAQGFDVEETALGFDELKEAFEDGAVVITCMGNGAFTEEGHFIVLAGMDSEDKVQVLDPISIYRTNKNWDAQQILRESKGTFWIIGR